MVGRTIINISRARNMSAAACKSARRILYKTAHISDVVGRALHICIYDVKLRATAAFGKIVGFFGGYRCVCAPPQNIYKEAYDQWEPQPRGSNCAGIITQVFRLPHEFRFCANANLL